MQNFEEFRKKFGKRLLEGEVFVNHTTLGIGGPIKLYYEVRNEEYLVSCVKLAKKFKIPFVVIGRGSNLLVSDLGFNGLVIKNTLKGIKENGGKINVKTGTTLWDLVEFTVDRGLLGMQKMIGIPGTVGGAIYGNAGAYGQSISDCLLRIRIFDGNKIYWDSKKSCNFGYRNSIFKRKDWILLEAEFKFKKGDKRKLIKESKEILSTRNKKYPKSLKCPGSFFKNIQASGLTQTQLKQIPEDKVVFDKVPAGYLLEEVGAKGQSEGEIKVADNHGNLIINIGRGKASDFYKLAEELKSKVKNRFGIELEPEVQLIGFDKKL